MAELLRTHPLESRAPALAEAGITVEPYVAMVNVRGTSVLQPNTWVTVNDGREIWLGPDERLLTNATEAPWEYEARIRAELAAGEDVVTDVSAQRIQLHLTGEHARDVLAKGCAIDLHPTVFPAGSAAQTRLGQAGVILLSLTEGYLVIVRSSFAGYLADWLLDAVDEFR
ncbi:sarcosine oxidase subunit gamma [Cryptosporangium sp. NPDC048952]|uniref:sarcosine oxidase subunit gamma n=1 Tax=Cryptosporangium sp. NPDC048952 TaxID=3363961 RepID=UPI003718D794